MRRFGTVVTLLSLLVVPAEADQLEGGPDLVALDVARGTAVAVGNNGEIWSMQLKRGLWAKIRKANKAQLRDVAAITRKDAWVVGSEATLLHFDGSEWRSPVGAPGQSFHAVAFADRRRGIALGDPGEIYQHVNDGWQKFHAMTRKPTLRQVARVGRGRYERFVAVGPGGEAAAFGGVGASLRVDYEVTGTKGDFVAIASCPGSRAEAVAVGTVAMVRDKTGQWIKLPDPPSALAAVAVRCKRGAMINAFGVADGALQSYDAATRTWTPRPIKGAARLNDIAWANSKQLLLVGNAGFWTLQPADPPPAPMPAAGP